MYNQSIDFIVSLSRDLISVGSADKILKVHTLFVKEGISTLPIIDGKRKNLGVIRKNDLWNITFKGLPKNFYDASVMDYKGNPLPEVNIHDSLSTLLSLLKNATGVLFKNEVGEYTKLITPRVVAMAFEKYASKFLEIERIEEVIRSILSKVPSLEPSKMTFGEYATAFSEHWEELNMGTLHKKEFNILFNKVQNYRNEVMHFRHDPNSSSKFEYTQQLYKLLKSVE